MALRLCYEKYPGPRRESPIKITVSPSKGKGKGGGRLTPTFKNPDHLAYTSGEGRILSDSKTPDNKEPCKTKLKDGTIIDGTRKPGGKCEPNEWCVSVDTGSSDEGLVSLIDIGY